ncbi:MAG: hypothetical protein E7172_02615 [Firmicutes bacterium]|nr:hypothetical protein [Bacillota bacterium]
MKNNLIKIITSLPIILLAIYLSSFLGICLIILRFFVINKNRTNLPIFLIVLGIICLLPKILNIFMEVKFLNEFINYGKSLIIIGVIFLIIGIIFEKISLFIKQNINSYMNQSLEQERIIEKENDLEIKIKQEKAKNTHYVKCPNCGSDNLISEKNSVCKYCRRTIVNKNYKV